MYSASNVYVEGVEGREMWGDAFLVGEYTSNINFYSVVADDNRRQGLSILMVDGCVIRDSIFKNTYGHLPQAGIDIEPTAPPDNALNIQVINNQFLNNKGSGVLVTVPNAVGTSSQAKNILISGNTVNTNGTVGLWNSGIQIEGYGTSNVTAERNTVTNSSGMAGILIDKSLGIVITNNTVTGNSNTAYGAIRDNTGKNTISGNIVN